MPRAGSAGPASTLRMRSAADSKAIRYYPNLPKDLGQALEEISQDLDGDVLNVGSSALRVNAAERCGLSGFESRGLGLMA
jgi:hypothetical protein